MPAGNGRQSDNEGYMEFFGLRQLAAGDHDAQGAMRLRKRLSPDLG